MFDKIKAWFKHSVTILWARIQVLLGALGATIVGLASDPSFQGAVQSFVKDYWWACLIIFGLITELARRRTAE